MNHQHIPARLHLLGIADASATAPENYVIKTRVDARTNAVDLKAKLTYDDKWTKGLDRGEIQYAIATLIGQEALRNNTHPFPNVGPSEPSEGYVVRRQPASEGWLLIEEESPEGCCEPVSAWSTAKQAVCASWDGCQGEPVTYAYYGIEVPVPDGYRVWRDAEPGEPDLWFWSHPDDSGSTPYGEGYDTDTDARIAAWRHKLNQPEAGPVEKDRYPMQPVALDSQGRPRFEANPIVEYLACTVSDLNHLAVWCAENDVASKYLEQLAQLIGYSVDGYGTLSYVSDESHERAAAQAERLVASREETITDE